MSLIAAAVALAIAPASGSFANETKIISSGGKPMFSFDIDRNAEAKPDDNLPEWSLTDAQLQGVLDAAEIWAGLFAPGAINTQAIPFNIVVENDKTMTDNASAGPVSWSTTDPSGREIEIPYLLAGMTLNRMPESAKEKSGTYTINQTSAGVVNGIDQGTDVMPFIYPVMTVDLGLDITDEVFTTTFHELSHALGILSNSLNVGAFLKGIQGKKSDTENPPTPQELNEYEQFENLLVNSGIVTRENLYTDGLTIYDVSAMNESLPFSDHLVSYWSRQGAENSYVLDFSKPTRLADGQLIVRLNASHQVVQPGTVIAPSLAFVAGEAQESGVYFVGENVSEVLRGSSLPGIPVNGWERTGSASSADLSHFELAHSMMSHQSWRNYVMLMEAELAAFQDIGYKIDRRNWFGSSEYGNNKTYVNTRPFYARNAEGTAYVEGTPNTATLATGFHVYGSGNNITQAADLLADGAGAAGIRVDGIGNTIRLAKGTRITANGSHGTGILVAYGKNQSIVVSGSVEAMGEGGRAISFDFGSNMLGDKAETRGSYIHVERNSDAALSGIDEGYEIGLDGPMGTLDISGTVKGSEAAIYIGRRAYVSSINIHSGARIEGDIISHWDPQSSEIHASYQDRDFTTTITFGLKTDEEGKSTGQADPNFAMSYSGDILSATETSEDENAQSGSGGSGGSGPAKRAPAKAALNSTPGTGAGSGAGSSSTSANPLKLVVAGGTLSLSGNVDVNSLTVRPQANLALANAAAGNTIQTETLDCGGSLLTGLSPSGELSGSVVVTDPDNSSSTGSWVIVIGENYYENGLAVQGSPIVDDNGDPIDSLLDTMTVSSSSATLAVRLVDGQYRIVRDSGVYASRSASDPSAREVGRALDAATASEGSLNAAARSVIGAVDSQTSARAVTAVLKKLSPEVYGYADAASIRMHREVTRTLARRMREQPLDGETPDGELAARDWKGFVMPYGERFIGNAQGRSSSTRSTSGGILAGLEKTDHRGLTLGLHAGVGGRHQSVSTWHDARVNSGGVFAGVHGQFAPEGLDGFYVTGSARVGLEENRSKRTVAIGSYYQKARGSYTSWTMEAMAGLGKDWKAGAVTFGPFASLEYIRTEHGSFKEKRAEGAGLSVRKGSNDALGAMLGAHAGVASRAEDGLIVRADLSAAYRRELLSTDYTAKAAFREIAGSDSFTGHARAMGRNAVIVDGTVGIANRADTLRAELTAGYEGANTGNSVRFGIRGQYRF